ncbi:carboxypeptidase-like regulatory domain-containing protein, partial [Myroides ceti]
MKMKLLLLGIFLYSSASFSQNSGSVTGNIKDMATKEAIPYATITIKSGEEILTGDMTNEEGKFTIKNIPYQTLTLEVEYIGFKNYSTTITVNNDKKDINLGDILLTQDSEVLEGLEIIAERSTIEQLVDRKVINVGKDLTTAGATAAEIMN